MAAPADSNRVTSQTTTAGTAHTINVGSPSAGTLLIVAMRFAVGTFSVQTFTGYDNLASDGSDPSGDLTTIYYRWADGSEGASDPLTTTGNTKMAGITWLVTGAADPSGGANDVPAISTVATGGTTGANSIHSSSVAPKVPPQDTLYLTFGGYDGETGAFTAAPTNYVNLAAQNSGTGGAVTTNVIVGGASRQINASSSDDAGVFQHGAPNAGWAAFAVAIRPPADRAVLAHPTNFGAHAVFSRARLPWHRRPSGIFIPGLA